MNMNLNKCARCGCFYITAQDVCPKCIVKDNYEIAKLQEFIEENGIPTNVEGLCDSTNISIKNMQRYLEKEQFAPLNKQFQSEL